MLDLMIFVRKLELPRGCIFPLQEVLSQGHRKVCTGVVAFVKNTASSNSVYVRFAPPVRLRLDLVPVASEEDEVERK